MAIHDYVISNASGAAVRQDLNDALAAIVSNNSNATAPTTTYAYQWWADTTNQVMKLRNAANTDWITLYQLDGEYTNITLEAGTNSAPSLRFVSDTNTGIYSPGADQVAITTGGTARLYVGSTGSVGIGSTTFSSVSGISGAKLQVLGGTIIGNDGASSNGSGWLAFDSACAAPTTSKPVIYHKAGTGLGIKSDYEINFEIGASDAVKIDNSKRLLVGTSTARSNLFGGGTAPQLQVEGTSFAQTTFSIVRNENVSTSVPGIALGKTRGSSNGANTVVQSGDNLGLIDFQGADGTNLIAAARISADVDGTPGTNDMPGRLVFSTTKDGDPSPTERMRIGSAGATDIFATNSTVLGLRTNLTAGTSAMMIGYNNASSTQNGTIVVVIRADGDLENANNSYGAYSDQKLKENIADAGSQWSDIKDLQVRKFNYKEETGYRTHTQIGLIAQEVELVSPGLVSESPDLDPEGNDLGTVTKSVKYSVLYMKAVKALQEAMERIETLEASNADLLARVSALESA